MCGLVGAVGDLNFKMRDMLTDMMFFNTLRGKDSTGLATVARDRSYKLRKSTIPGYDFIQMPNFNNMFSAGDQLWMAHARYKTTGDVSRLNAHPFEVLNDDEKTSIIGCHNGTLDNKWTIEDKLGGERFGTDSEALLHWLYEAPSYKEAIAAARGAWSLVWWDAPANQLCFLRNDKRPLVYSYTKDREALFWASETWMILAAARRNGIELETTDKGLSCVSTSPDVLYTLDIPQQRNKKLGDMTKEGGHVGQPDNTFQRNRAGFGWWGEADDLDDPLPKSFEKAEEEAAKEGKVSRKEKPIIEIGGLKGFEGEPISVDELRVLKEAGCCWCGRDCKTATISFIAKNDIVCQPCMRGLTRAATIPQDNKKVVDITEARLQSIVKKAQIQLDKNNKVKVKG